MILVNTHREDMATAVRAAAVRRHDSPDPTLAGLS